MAKDSTSILYHSFAQLLAYPTAATFQQAQMCLEQLRQFDPQPASAMEDVCRVLESLSLESLEELYTVTFDMQPVCYPYVGYQLFGESYKRGAFMAQLNEAYDGCGYSAGQELPDHLSVILHFLGLSSTAWADDFGRTLLVEGLKPALEKMVKAFNPHSANPYFGILSALQQVLVHTSEKELDHA
jgi:nitrate reductase molybdenum cofactor assembly chaperone NarJ/NarW